MSSPHVVMVSKGYPPWMGGIERHVQDLGEALVKRGWKVTALVCREEGDERRECLNGVEVIRVKTWGRILSQPIAAGYYRRLRELQPELVHVHVPFPLGWLTAAQVEPSVPVICTWHSDIVRQRFLRVLYRPFEQRFLQRCRRVLCTSPVLCAHSRELAGFQEKTRVVPLAIPELPGLSDAAFADELRQLRESSGKPLVSFVGRLVGYKGLRYLLQAMERVDAQLLIAGDGPLGYPLENWVEKLPWGGRIHLLGEISEAAKVELYRRSEVFVLPSISENEAFGMVLLEAMREGCPVVTTDLPTGVNFVNQDGVTGLVVPRKTSLDLAQAINRILQHPDLREQFSQAARQRVQEFFSFESMLTAIEGVYREVLGERRE